MKLKNNIFSYLFFLCLIITAPLLCEYQNTIECDERLNNYQKIECELEHMPSRITSRGHPYISGTLAPFYKSPQSVIRSSTNWAGHVAVTDINHLQPHSFTFVSGSWTVPIVKCDTAHQKTYSAIWIGIDGYNNSTVEQIGTAHDCINGNQRHYAWFEMYPGASYSITNFKIKSGDSITATITYTGQGVFVMTIYNNTQKTYATIPTARTTSTTAECNCAEWIVEAPFSGGILPLANFGSTMLTNCQATMNGTLSSLGLLPHIQLMMTSNNNTIKASTSSVHKDNTSFDVLWHGN